MNILECTVVEVLSTPEYKYNKWFVKVSYTCYGLKVIGKRLKNKF